VQDGSQSRPTREIYTSTLPANTTLDEWTRGREFKNRQVTVTGRLKKQLSEQLNLELMQSFDIWCYRNHLMGVSPQVVQHGRETELFSRAILTWTPSDVHSLAFGADYSHEWFDEPPFSYALDRTPVVTDRKWRTDTLSFMTEHQWKINKRWTTFVSVRTDKHTYSDWLFSPRGSAVYTPTEQDTFKFIVGRSVRRGGDEELWSQWKRQKSIPDPETLNSYEVSYERKLTDHWRVGGSGFYEDYEAIGWIPSLYYSSSIGDFQIAGGELEVSYTTRDTRLTLSHGISKLVDSHLPDTLPQAGQTVSAHPYGYGKDLAEWSPFITKLALVHDFSKAWSVSSSAVYYSGFPGAKDYANYAYTLPSPPSAVALSDPGYSEPYGPNLFLNFGTQYRPSERWTFRVDAYNLAELFDETLSKRNHYFRMSEFSVLPASLAFSLTYRF
jgi:iron complex outermembrane receptor protein